MKVVRAEEKKENARLGVRICLEGYHFGEFMRISANAMTEEEKAPAKHAREDIQGKRKQIFLL